MKKQVQIIMLPTEKATHIINDRGNLEFISHKQIASTINSIVTGINLYFLSDDEIKEGDWCLIDNNVGISTGYQILKCEKADNKNGWYYFGHMKTGRCQKIITTTDEDLGYGDEFGDFYQLPRPSNEFLKKYCELGGIDKVLVEYEKVTVGWLDALKGKPNYSYKLKAPNNTITIYPI